MGNRNVTIPVATAIPGARAIDADFLAADYEPDISSVYGQVVTVHIAIDDTANSIIEYTRDGTKFHSFLNGEVLKADSAIERQITLRFGDKLNFRAKTAITLDYCLVDLV